ncbi:Immunity protein 50 [Bacillus sp. 491mf]|uniref:Imm50 family immunity protein n=1 Tax=unclassified Bacillus (in: firmicutes) TaxID=185979 RepID=UPI000556CF29|nr:MULTISPECIES: Imm50 family immunity protein [unclassified Bacillus (in: firmicutes)]SFC82725.1 Immunity protein 50 [Bacillus sp. 491mf]
MWYSDLEGNRFISTLYKEAPSLLDVRIVAVKIEDEGKKVSINFNMPKFADNPPEKWEQLNYNTVFVQLDFFDIQELTLKSSNDKYRGDIHIELDKDGKFNINISGSVSMNLKADYGIIQSVSGYIDTIE